MANVTPTPKAVALVLIPALVLMLAFAFSYVGAFHDPTPHHVPVAIVGPAGGGGAAQPAARRPARCAPGLVPRRCAVADRRPRGLRRLRGRHEPPVRRFGRQPRDRHRAGADLQPDRRRAATAGGPRHRRQAAAAQGPERHRGVLRGDRVGVRRLHRRDADRPDRQPAQQQQAARGCADRSARGVWHRRRNPQRGDAARLLRRVLGPRGRAVRDRGADHLRQRRRHGGHPGRGRPGRDRARDPRLRDPRQRRIRRAVRPAAAAGSVEDDRRRSCRRARASTWRDRHCSSTARGSRARFSCWSLGRPWVLGSRSRSAVASWTRLDTEAAAAAGAAI